MLLEDCNGIVRSYVSILSQPTQPQQAQHGDSQPDLEKMLGNMESTLKNANDLKNRLGENNV